MDCSLELVSNLSPSDQRLFVEYGFGQHKSATFGCVHHAFEHQAAVQPDTIAVEHLGASISYSELDACANRLANHLRLTGIIPGARVCLLMERSIIFVAAILAVLKAGGAYVPLDGGIVTQSTLEHVLRDSNTPIVLTVKEYCHRVPASSTTLVLDNSMLDPSKCDCVKPEDLSNPEDSVYIIYTSGTTGVPKGVEVKHSNVTNLVLLAPGNVGMAPGRRVSQLLNIAFDMAAWEILGSMCNGCTLCVRGKSSREWRAVMKTVDIVIATPSMMTPHDPADYPNIRVVATAGEPCPQALADRWAENGTFYNSCGPTEITIVNTVQSHVKGTPLTIGKPTPNNNVYVLDEKMKPLPIGEVGIMWAGGAGITRGYINLPEKTAERYVEDPFVADGSYMFNTGDLGRWTESGTLEPLGRIDDQVKVKGFRVELDGVASAIMASPEVKSALALLIGAELWGFVAPATVDLTAVIAVASKVRPPGILLDPRLGTDIVAPCSNGKTDKRALRQMALNKLASEAAIIIDEKENVFPSAIVSVKENIISPSLLKELAQNVLALPPTYQGFSPAKEIGTGDVLHGLPMLDSMKLASQQSSTASPSITEKGNAWDGYEDEDLPNKAQGPVVRNLRHRIFTLYRRLFGVVFITNAAVFIATIVDRQMNAQKLGLIVVTNLFCAILMRQDYVINMFFNIFCAVPTSWPLAIRRVCARVYHIGGLHSGCAISGVMWLILFTYQATKELLTGGPTSVATVVMTYWILLLLLGITTLAYPRFRSLYHNRFEMSHRFLGWTATAFVWTQVILLTNDYRKPGQSLGDALVHAAPFWLILGITCSIVLPWLRLRKVPVRAEVMSSHAVRLHFDYVTPVPGSFTRISKSPLLEWHSFATVPVPGQKGYSLVVSKAGDWTSESIAEPPKELWVRGIPTCGVLRIVPLFRRLVFVATGSGIGPCAPCILEQRVPIRLLWTSPNVRKTFGDSFVDSIMDASPDAVVYDTRVHGKPDMVKLTYRLVREFKAEAVCVISNQKLTEQVVYGMMSRGIPAFGAIWDS